MLQPIEIEAERRAARPAHDITESELDAALEGSFPASDPPSWTAGIVRPSPKREPRQRSTAGAVQRMLWLVAGLL
jgi:hypothetical protein